jgi:hypothetical protein
LGILPFCDYSCRGLFFFFKSHYVLSHAYLSFKFSVCGPWYIPILTKINLVFFSWYHSSISQKSRNHFYFIFFLFSWNSDICECVCTYIHIHIHFFNLINTLPIFSHLLCNPCPSYHLLTFSNCTTFLTWILTLFPLSNLMSSTYFIFYYIIVQYIIVEFTPFHSPLSFSPPFLE